VADASALRDLGVVLVWTGAFILASLAYYIAKAVAFPLDISIPFVGRPFKFIADAIENGIIEPLNDLRAKSDAEIARGLSGLVDDLAVVLGLFLVLGLIVKAALSYLWNHALSPFIHAITDPIRGDAHRALAEVESLAGTVAADLVRAEHYADAAAAGAVAAAISYADRVALGAEHAAERYADDAVAKLRSAEDSAIANAVEIADAAKAAGLAAAAGALATAEREISAGVTAAERYAATTAAAVAAAGAKSLAEAEAAASTALAQVKAIAIGAEGDLTDLEAYIKSLGLPAVIAGVGALATVVTIALAETGLENASCRTKVKGICGTDPAAWAALLAGAAVLGVSFDLGDIVDAALALLDETTTLIGDIGQIADSEIETIGQAIGEAALRIAA
jgi:hypothetical protein